MDHIDWQCFRYSLMRFFFREQIGKFNLHSHMFKIPFSERTPIPRDFAPSTAAAVELTRANLISLLCMSSMVCRPTF